MADITERQRHLRGQPETRAGFTLVEVIVAGVIITILAAVTVPQVMDALKKKRVEDSYEVLRELHYGFVNSNQTGFLDIVRSAGSATNSSPVPGRLSHLSEAIVSQNVNYVTSCNGGGSTTNSSGYYQGNTATTWTLGGPFVKRVVSTTDGLAIPIGQIQNALVRTPSAPPLVAPAWIQMRINNVDPEDAAALDLRVDGVAGAAAGTIQYTTDGGTGISTVNYLIPVANRC